MKVFGSGTFDDVDPFFAWVKEVLYELLALLERDHLSKGEDSCSWWHSLDGKYSICSTYATLSTTLIQSGGRSEAVVDSLDLIWHSWAPSKDQHGSLSLNGPQLVKSL